VPGKGSTITKQEEKKNGLQGSNSLTGREKGEAYAPFCTKKNGNRTHNQREVSAKGKERGKGRVTKKKKPHQGKEKPGTAAR